MSWAPGLKRVFAIDITTCPQCSHCGHRRTRRERQDSSPPAVARAPPTKSPGPPRRVPTDSLIPLWIPVQCLRRHAPFVHFPTGAVEKSRQRRSHQFSVLTYWKYAPRAKPAAALPLAKRRTGLDGSFGKAQDKPFLNSPDASDIQRVCGLICPWKK
jgi:hypothetical protein